MQTIYLDISNKGVIPTIHAKQGDVGRKFLVVVTDSGVPYTLGNDDSISVWYEGESGEGNYSTIGGKSAFSVNGNKIVVEMITQMLANSGSGVLSLVITDKNGYQIGMWNIEYETEAVPGMDSPLAEQYYTAFLDIATKAQDSANRAEAAAEKLVIDNTLSVSGQAADAAAVGVALESAKTKFDLLWANPAVTSAFAEKSIEIANLTPEKYDGIAVRFNYTTALGYNQTVTIIGNYGACAYFPIGTMFTTADGSKSVSVGTSRYVRWDGGNYKVYFGPGHVGDADNDTGCIPVAIYGIKW